MSTWGQAITGVVGIGLGIIFAPAGLVSAYAMMGLSAGLTLGGILFPKKQAKPIPQALQIQTAAYGIPITVLYGTRRIAGNLCGYWDFTKHEREEGGKGGAQVTGYTYSVSLVFALCVGPTPMTVTKIWAGQMLLKPEQWRYCDGTQTTPDSYIASKVSRAPVWKGLCYVILENYDLGASTALPNFTYEVQAAGKQDAPPTDVSKDALTNKLYGMGFDESYLDLDIFAETEAYCQTNDLLVSMVFDQQLSILDLLQYVINHHNGFITYANGKISHNQIKDDPVVAVLSADPGEDVPREEGSQGDMPVSISKAGLREYSNKIEGHYFKRLPDSVTIDENGNLTSDILTADEINAYPTYQPGLVVAEDMTDIAQYGTQVSNAQLDGFCLWFRAMQVATIMLKRSLYNPMLFKFKLGPKSLGANIMPGKVVSLTDTATELDAQTMRILSIAEGEDYQIEVEALEEDSELCDVIPAVGLNAACTTTDNGAPIVQWLSCPGQSIVVGDKVWFVTTDDHNPDTLYIISHDPSTGLWEQIYSKQRADAFYWLEPDIAVASKNGITVVVLTVDNDIDYFLDIYVFQGDILLRNVQLGTDPSYGRLSAKRVAWYFDPKHLAIADDGTISFLAWYEDIASPYTDHFLLYQSNDNGVTWTTTEIHSSTYDAEPIALEQESDTIIWATNLKESPKTYPLYKSLDGGAHFSYKSNIPNIYFNLYDIFSHGGDIYGVTYKVAYYSGLAIQKSIDGGLNFTQYTVDDGTEVTTVWFCNVAHCHVDNYIYLVAYKYLKPTSYPTNGVFDIHRSLDGEVWTKIGRIIPTVLVGEQSLHIDYSNGIMTISSYYAAGLSNGQLFKAYWISEDDGFTWEEKLTGFYDATGMPDLLLTGMLLSWNTNNFIPASVEIYRKLVTDESYTLIATITDGSTSYTDYITPDIAYQYYIKVTKQDATVINSEVIDTICES